MLLRSTPLPHRTQLALFPSMAKQVAPSPRPDRMPTREEARALVQAGAFDPPPGVRFELEAWALVSSVTIDGPSK